MLTGVRATTKQGHAFARRGSRFLAPGGPVEGTFALGFGVVLGHVEVVVAHEHLRVRAQGDGVDGIGLRGISQLHLEGRDDLLRGGLVVDVLHLDAAERSHGEVHRVGTLLEREIDVLGRVAREVLGVELVVGGEDQVVGVLAVETDHPVLVLGDLLAVIAFPALLDHDHRPDGGGLHRPGAPVPDGGDGGLDPHLLTRLGVQEPAGHLGVGAVKIVQFEQLAGSEEAQREDERYDRC